MKNLLLILFLALIVGCEKTEVIEPYRVIEYEIITLDKNNIVTANGRTWNFKTVKILDGYAYYYTKDTIHVPVNKQIYFNVKSSECKYIRLIISIEGKDSKNLFDQCEVKWQTSE